MSTDVTDKLKRLMNEAAHSQFVWVKNAISDDETPKIIPLLQTMFKWPDVVLSLIDIIGGDNTKLDEVVKDLEAMAIFPISSMIEATFEYLQRLKPAEDLNKVKNSFKQNIGDTSVDVSIRKKNLVEILKELQAKLR